MTGNFCLSIAGHDPTDGAGFSSDVKTFAVLGVESLSVCTAITFQNHDTFDAVEWMTEAKINRQLNMLLGNYNISAIKIGLIENLTSLHSVLKSIIDFYKTKPELEKPFIIWDPILSASVGYTFHSKIDEFQLKEILENIDLITPNIPEAEMLFPNIDFSNIDSSPFTCHVLLKGGHGSNTDSIDVLFTKHEKRKFSLPRLKVKMHGTGCVLSAAIAANIALGNSIENSVEKAKKHLYYRLQQISTT